MFKKMSIVLLYQFFIFIMKLDRKLAYRWSWDAVNQYQLLTLQKVGSQIQALIEKEDSDRAWSEWHHEEHLHEAIPADAWAEINGWRDDPTDDMWEEDEDEPHQVWLSEPPGGFYIYE